MALTADLVVTFENKSIVLTDNTTYGANGNPLRTAVTVEFAVTKKHPDGDKAITLPAYTPATVTTLSFAAVDGWHEIVMTIKGSGGETNPSDTENVINVQYLDDCIKKYRDAWACDCCGGDNTAFLDYQKVQATKQAISEYDIAERYADAQCLVDGIQVLCKESDGCC